MPITLDSVELAKIQAVESAKVLRENTIETNLPSWSKVSTAVDNISSLAEAKAYIKKLSRVVYWLAKNSEE